MTRKIDKERTKEARARQAAGKKKLDDLFRVPDAIRRLGGLGLVPTLHGLALTAPIRMKAGCPPLRSAARRARHVKRKKSRAARRRNRA